MPKPYILAVGDEVTIPWIAHRFIICYCHAILGKYLLWSWYSTTYLPIIPPLTWPMNCMWQKKVESFINVWCKRIYIFKSLKNVLLYLVCDIPSPIDHGNLTILPNDTVVLYSCEVGYTLNGSSIRVCQSDGSGWDGKTPACGKMIRQ